MANEEKVFKARAERRDAAENRQRILDAAFRLFGKNGVERVSMNQIAIEANVGPATLYRRYKNKSEICLDLIKDNIDLLFEDIDEYFDKNRDEAPSIRFKGVLSIFIRFRENKAQLLKGVEDSSSARSSKPLASNPIYYEWHQIFANLFNEMDADNPAFRADMLLNALRSESYLFQREVRSYSPEIILEQLYNTFIVNSKCD